MPATRNKSKAAGSPAPMAVSENGTNEVLTLAEAAAYLRVSEEDVVRLVPEQDLPGRRIGQEWRFLKAALQGWLSTPPSPQERLMQWAGAFKGDPDLKDIVEEAHRQRGRATTRDDE